MKASQAIFTIIIGSLACEKEEFFSEGLYQCSGQITNTNPGHPKKAQYEELLAEMVASGVPGVLLTVHDNQNGYWSGAAGLADIGSQVTLLPCHITRVGSTVKTFTAVTILQLQEDGLLDIDRPITEYLSGDDIKGIENADKATVRQLLQHSSGIFNYIQSAQFQTASLNDLTKTWQPDELLDYARGADSYFAPGTDVQYSNTGYVLLGRVIERVTGRPFAEIFGERIFNPLDLRFTQCAALDPVPSAIIRGYVDFYSNLNLINSTYYSGWDYYTADGGLISNAYDLNVFLTALFKGNLLTPASMTEMMSWLAPSQGSGDGFTTLYGLGIFKIETEFGPAYMHSGDAIGYFASMVYFPEQEVTITWAVNGNYGKVDQFTQSKDAMNKIFEVVLE
jgi:D-alanyl-D-alanine carboxypeptidase